MQSALRAKFVNAVHPLLDICRASNSTFHPLFTERFRQDIILCGIELGDIKCKTLLVAETQCEFLAKAYSWLFCSETSVSQNANEAFMRFIQTCDSKNAEYGLVPDQFHKLLVAESKMRTRLVQLALCVWNIKCRSDLYVPEEIKVLVHSFLLPRTWTGSLNKTYIIKL
jgi:hypothetical protein